MLAIFFMLMLLLTLLLLLLLLLLEKVIFPGEMLPFFLSTVLQMIATLTAILCPQATLCIEVACESHVKRVNVCWAI